MGFSTPHLIILLVIVLVLFGTKKLKNIGSDLGSAVKGFKDGMKDSDKPEDAQAAKAAPQVTATDHRAAGETIDVEAKNR